MFGHLLNLPFSGVLYIPIIPTWKHAAKGKPYLAVPLIPMSARELESQMLLGFNHRNVRDSLTGER